jgi:hypothetical protein
LKSKLHLSATVQKITIPETRLDLSAAVEAYVSSFLSSAFGFGIAKRDIHPRQVSSVSGLDLCLQQVKVLLKSSTDCNLLVSSCLLSANQYCAGTLSGQVLGRVNSALSLGGLVTVNGQLVGIASAVSFESGTSLFARAFTDVTAHVDFVVRYAVNASASASAAAGK